MYGGSIEPTISDYKYLSTLANWMIDEQIIFSLCRVAKFQLDLVMFCEIVVVFETYLGMSKVPCPL
jgi:hypothetical protein